jgi:hypothetical protein
VVSNSKKKSDRKSYYTDNIVVGFVESPLFENSLGKVGRIEKEQPLQKIATSLESIEIPSLSIGQRLVLRVGGALNIRIQERANHEPIELFLRRCSKHGIVVTYPQGYDGILRCPKCAQDRRKIRLQSQTQIK